MRLGEMNEMKTNLPILSAGIKREKSQVKDSLNDHLDDGH